MKVLIAIIALFFISNGYSQYNPEAPWMKAVNTLSGKSTSNEFDNLVNAFDQYWKNRDAMAKGSGHKPFKRWETFWKDFVKKDGNLPSPNELWQTWQAKQQFSQSKTMADVSNWQPLGPFNHTNTGSWSSGQGRINTIIVDPNNPNIYYAGAPAGGIWKSTDAGNNWTPLSDYLPQIGVSGIAVDYNNSNIIYIATGDDDNADTYSVGVMKSMDGGLTWNTTGLNTSTGSPNNMNEIYMHPANSNTLWVATNKGVYKTTDAGTTWSNANGTQNLNIKDIKLKPSDHNTIYAVTSRSLYVSTDGGDTFTSVGFGIDLPTPPQSNIPNRMVIDITPDNPNVVYLLNSLNNEFEGLYKSTDAGVNFTKLTANVPAGEDLFDGSNQAYYDMALTVSPNNENELYVGVLNIWKSINGGTDFSRLNQWYLPKSASYTHADIHFLRFFNNDLFAGTDGGFYKTSDGGINFTDLSAGMQIGQFYRLSVSKETSKKMIGGLQDNGGYALNGMWQVFYGADGMDTAIHPSNSNKMYGFIQYGSQLYISNTSGGSSDAYASIPPLEIDEDNGDYGGNWITPLKMNRNGELFAGYSSLYQLAGTNWVPISSSFGNNLNIEVLEIDEQNSNTIYLALSPNNDTTLRKSVDGGETFSTTYVFPTEITSIEVNNNNSNIIYVTTSGGSGGVFISTDGGSTFDNITGSLPNVTKNIIKHQDLHSDNPLFLGTSLGVYRYDDTTGDWEPFENNLPNVAVRDLEINLNDGNITAATYGRGIWQSDIPVQALQNEISIEKIADATALVSCGTVDSVKAIVKNWGANDINSLMLSYTIDGVTDSFVWTGTIAPNSTAGIAIPSFNISGQGQKELKLNVSMGNDTFLNNNELTTYLFANNSGTFNTANDFEPASKDLLVIDDNSSLAGYWEKGIPTGALLNAASSGDQVYGTNLSGLYDNNIKSYLVTPCYDLSLLSNPIFKFDMAFDLEPNWDIMYVEYTIDSGLNWTVLGTASDLNWYNSNRLPGSDCINCPGAQWTGTDAAMKEYSYDLSSLNSPSEVIFRFVFHSDQYTVNEGVIIDDLVVEGTLNVSEFDTKAFSIYPNPSKGIFNISSKSINTFDYDITDIAGKIILNERNVNLINHTHQIDLSTFTAGVYFMNLTSENRKTTKKLVVK